MSPHDSARRQPRRAGQGRPGDARACRWRTRPSTSAGSSDQRPLLLRGAEQRPSA
ncbi:MAG: hypothetical protein MZW92_79130 [Comamonadaceae bacterium]|nr:hypothetical protein [Comamonadaceae bacterium]